ncbi:MAG: polysaccharide deacetylase family protein [Anditalea sp.]
MLFHHIPTPLQLLFPYYVWHKSRKQKSVYLTFDDGPVPGVTDFVLEELAKRQMKATFFMVGDNLLKHPGLALKVKQQGHQIGNHTHNHLNGHQCSSGEYWENFARCQAAIKEVLDIRPYLFRAPYGRIKKQQRKKISRTHQIIMWDVLPGDFNRFQTATVCLAKAKQHTQNGSIVVFHDQKKTEKILLEILPDFLDFIQENGYQTDLL